MERDFRELLVAKWNGGKFLCVGLDPDFNTIPPHLQTDGIYNGLTAFNRAIIDATKDIAGSYKPNSAFYEACGDVGWRVLRETIQYIHECDERIPVIADCKRGDIGSTNKGYVDAVFGDLQADAITVHPYLGREALQPILDMKHKGVIVLCRTSNPGASEIQDMRVDDVPLYQIIARKVAHGWNENGNCALVVGATYPEELAQVRAIAPDLPILIPGIGAQGGEVEATVRAGIDARGAGIMISASRSIIYASKGEDFAEAARIRAQALHSAIGAARVR